MFHVYEASDYRYMIYLRTGKNNACISDRYQTISGH
jgi:hypothetical protein